MTTAKIMIVEDETIIAKDIETRLRRMRKLGFDNVAIIITGSPNSPVITDFKKYGFDDLLLKPYTKTELGKTIRKFLPV